MRCGVAVLEERGEEKGNGECKKRLLSLCQRGPTVIRATGGCLGSRGEEKKSQGSALLASRGSSVADHNRQSQGGTRAGQGGPSG